MINIDENVLLFFNRAIHSDMLNPVFIFFSSKIAALLFLILQIVLLIKGYRTKDRKLIKNIYIMLVVTGITIALADLISSKIFKPFFQRPRPCQTIADLWFWEKKSGVWELTDGVKSFKRSFSFISSHASNAMGVAVLWSVFYKKWAWLFIMIAILVGISRMYLGVHYPSDIIGGFALGSFVAFFTRYIVEMLNNKYI